MIRNLSDLSLASLNNHNVMVVDDDPEVLERLSRLLLANGLRPSCFDSPAAALDHRNGGYPLAFIDVGLPGANGLELAASLRNAGEIQDVVFMSSRECLDMTLKALRAGAWDFLHKPLCDNDIAMLLQRFSERRELRRRVAEAERKHSMLIQDLPVLVFEMNPRLEFTFVNQACLDILGFSVEEALADKEFFLSRLHPQDREIIQDSCRRAFQTGSNFTLECRLLHRQGRAVHGILRSTSQSANGSGPEILDVVFMDITDRVYLERALVQNEKLKTLGEVSAEVAHEIRNPLMSIAGFARRLEQKSGGHPEAGIILRESQRLEKLLDRIRKYLEPVNVNYQLCQVNSVLGDSLRMLQSEFDERQVRYEISLKDDLTEAVADPLILQQVFLNLFRFALPRFKPGTTLQARTQESESHILVEIVCPRDGALPSDTEGLFLPFEENGLSTGISSAYRLVRNMRSLLSVVYEGESAVIGVSIPKAELSLSMDRLLHEWGRNSDALPCFVGDSLLSRSCFDDLLERNVRLAVRERRPLSLIFIDVEGFDAYERARGREKAEAVLAAIGQTLESSLTKSHYLLGKYGSQEFAVLLPDAGEAAAKALAASMDAGIRAHSLPEGLPGLRVRFGISSGVPEHQFSAQDIIAHSVKALHSSSGDSRTTSPEKT